MKTNTLFDHMALREMLQTKVVEKIITHFMFNIFFFNKIVPLMRNEEKFSRGGECTVENMAHAHCMLDT
jgi:hypothetical protein